MSEFLMIARAFVVLLFTFTPLVAKFRMWQSSIMSSNPEMNCTPSRPVPIPSNSRPTRVTLSVGPADTTKPFVPDTSTPPFDTYRQLIVMDLVMVSAPNPPGSRQSISPSAEVLEIAPANVLQGAVRLHGLASSPTPETQVRVAWA